MRIAERIGEHDDGARGYLVLGELARQVGDAGPGPAVVSSGPVEIAEPNIRQPGMSLLGDERLQQAGLPV